METQTQIEAGRLIERAIRMHDEADIPLELSKLVREGKVIAILDRDGVARFMMADKTAQKGEADGIT